MQRDAMHRSFHCQQNAHSVVHAQLAPADALDRLFGSLERYQRAGGVEDASLGESTDRLVSAGYSDRHPLVRRICSAVRSRSVR